MRSSSAPFAAALMLALCCAGSAMAQQPPADAGMPADLMDLSARALAGEEPAPVDAGAAEGVTVAPLDAGTPERMTVEPFGAPPEPLTVEAFEPADAGASMAVEAFAPPSAPEPDRGFTLFDDLDARVYGWLRAEASVDTVFDSPRDVPLAENVAEGRARGLVGVDVKLAPRLRLVVEGRAQVRGATQRDFDRAKGFFEPMLGDAYLDVYSPKVDVRVGNQRIALGANAAMAPADALNPRDLRESLVNADPEDAVLPVFAVRAQGEVGTVSWLAAYAPFFTPHRTFVFGQDEALMQPALAPAFDNRRIDPSIEDFVQDRVLETKRPPPFAGDVALRFSREGRVRVGASWLWVNEKLPRVRVDAELSRLMASQVAGKPADPATAASVLNRFNAGETLFQGTYGRSHLLSLEASTLLGPGQLDGDLTYTPRQTFFDPSFSPVDKAAVTWVLGYSKAGDDGPWFWAVTWFGMAVPDVAAKQQLILVEPATSVGIPRTAWLHLFVGAASWKGLDDKLEVSLRAAFEPVQLSFTVAPRVSWLGFEKWELSLAAELYEGPAWSPLGYYGRNDKVWLAARYTLF